MDLGILLTAFLVLLSHLVPLLSAHEYNQSSSVCPQSFQCPNLGNLSFPYTTISQPDCGLCMVDCDYHPYPKIQLAQSSEQWFYATGNDKEDFIRVNDPILESYLNHKNCTSFSHHIHLPNSSSITFRTSSMVTLFKCNKPPPSPRAIHHLEGYRSYEVCEDFNVYYKNPKDAGPPENPPPGCLRIHLPFRSCDSENPPPGYSSINLPFRSCDSERNEVFELLTANFELGWNVSKECYYGCHLKGGQCRTDKMNNFLCANAARQGKNNRRLVILFTAIGGSAFLLMIVLVSFLIWHRKKHTKNASYYLSRNTSSTKPELEGGRAYFGIPVFSYTELEEATNKFDTSKELGDGGFGTVYHGKLRDGREVAVKRLYKHNLKRMEQFINEVKILTRLRHRNLVTLYGCTSRHSRELLLVYEYIPNGTVADHLHASDIIHRDVKTNNILLDHNFGVKVADFGLSRLFPNDASHVSTAPQGTPGYVDPEYHQCYKLTDRSDVYSFGVVLIELISSMPAVDIGRHRHEINLAKLAINRIQRRAFNELIDPSLGFESDPKVTRMTTSVAELAFLCLQLEKEMRPTMDEVLATLKQIQNYNDNSGGMTKETNENAIEFDSRTAKIPPSPESEDVSFMKKEHKSSTFTKFTSCMG